MKRPTWVTTVGVLGIIFSCFGILGAGGDIMMPKMLEFQKEIFTVIEKEAEKEMERQREKAAASAEAAKAPEGQAPVPFQEAPLAMFRMMGRMWDMPDWFKTWSIFSGMTRLLLNGLYLFSSVVLLLMKPYSIRLFYFAAGASIVYGIVRGVVTVTALNLIGMGMMFGSIVGVIVDIVLLVVVATGDKRAFHAISP